MSPVKRATALSSENASTLLMNSIPSTVIHPAIVSETIEVAVRGKWLRKRALQIGERSLITQGKWLKTAVVNDEEWLPGELNSPEQYLQYLREHRSALPADIFSFAQLPPSTVPRHRYPFEMESFAAAPTSSYANWWESLPQESRKNVRRSQKRGVELRLETLNDALIQGILEINNASPLRQGRANYHFGKNFEQTKKDHGSFLDRSEFIGAYAGSELIGYLKVVYRDRVASVLNLAVKSEHHDKRPSNALLAKCVELCESKGKSHLIYGRFNYGNKTDSSIREYKIRNGFEEMLCPRYYIPLTVRGKLAVKLQLHRGLLQLLPPSMIAFGLHLRSKWYALK